MTAALATAEERTFVRRLEADLRRDGRPSAEVMNFGVASASTASELLTWRGVVAEHGPDVVLLAFFNGNDLADNSSRLTRAPRVYFELDGHARLLQGPEPAPTPAAVRWLDRHSRLYTWQKVAFRQLRSAVRSGSAGLEPVQMVFARAGRPDVEHAWRLTGALLGRMRDEVEATGARFGVVVIPCAEQVDDGLWAELARRARGTGIDVDRREPSRRLAAVLEREGIPSLDLAPLFAEAARPEGSADSLYLLGRFHLNDEGHRVVAEAIHRFLTRGEGRPLLQPR
jgi:lysophospholipase L1-like esterase